MNGRHPDETQTLLGELRWLTRMRWIAGLAMLAAAVVTSAVFEQTAVAGRIAIVGALVLVYNALLHAGDRFGSRPLARVSPEVVGAVQMVLDLASIVLLTTWTGGIESPALGLFVLHMVIASMLLRPVLAYGAVVLAVLMLFVALFLTDQWPRQASEVRIALPWLILLLLTVAAVNHVTVELRLQRRRLRQESDRIQAILETAADGIITIDDAGCIRSVNSAAERIFGHEKADMVGRNVSMLMTEPDRSRHDDYMERYRRTGEGRIIGNGREVVGRRKSGETFPIDLAVSEVTLDDGALYAGIVRDISERKAADAQLSELYSELKRQQQALIQQEKMVAIGQMAAGVAHEISNPLAALDSLVQVVQRRPERLDDEALGRFDEQVKRIGAIVRQLTEFAHPVDQDWATVSINELVSDAIQLLRFDHRIRAIDVQTHYAAGAVARIVPQAISQVFINLLGNAIDALDGVADPRLEISTRVTDEQCVIDVRDNGAGIPEQEQARVFDPFFTTKPVGRGTGLGLAISFNLVKNHGGRIDLESEVGVGSCFTVLLPLSPDREPPAGDDS